MEDLESQIAKIQLENSKSTNSYVYTMVEKAGGSDCELYMVAELPLLNPAAKEDCEKICLAIASAFRRAFRKPVNDNSFESAVSEINEELGKLTAFGQTYWLDKLNCVLGVKNGRMLTITTTGKVAAYLLRGREFTDISCSAERVHPLKTFENMASGKIKLGDLLILSTTQLFNYLSLDRVRGILESGDFLPAAQTIIELLKENAGPGVSFGALFNLQVPMGATPKEEIDLENYVVDTRPQNNFFAKLLAFAKTAFALDKTSRVPKAAPPKAALSGRLKNLGGAGKNAYARGQRIFQIVKSAFSKNQQSLNLKNFKSFSPQKKFFLGAASLFLLAFITNLIVAANYSHSQQIQQKYFSQIQDSQKLISNAQSSLLYKNETGARDYLVKAQNTLPDSSKLNAANTNLYSQAFSQLQQLTQQMEKITKVHVTTISTFGQSSSLIKLPGIIASQSSGHLISYNLQTGKLEDGKLIMQTDAKNSVSVGGTQAVIYTGQNLLIWNFQDGSLGPAFSSNVPQGADEAGLAFYPTNKRVYLVDKKQGKIFSFAVAGKTLGKPVVAVNSQSQDLTGALDLAIDGNLYVFSPQGITKYHSGQPAQFSVPALIQPLGGQGKIYTQPDFKYLYVLDAANKRIVVLTKQGGMVETLVNPEFDKPTDFTVDEKNKTIYLLNDGSLLRLQFP